MLSGSGELRPTLVRLSAKDIEQAKMASPVVRRHTAPQVAQQIWAAITYVRSQKQIANTERIMRYMNRQFQFTQSEAKALLHHAVADGLVERYVLVGSKGAKLGVEQEGFKLPEPHDDVNRDEHDWYCFECHIQGEVLECSGCWRVYHSNCVQFEGGKFLCPVCQELEVSKNKQRIKRKELNRLLSYTVNRLKEKTRDLMKLFHTADEQKLKRFIYQHMDLGKMENKTKNRKYRYLEQFEADAQTIYHNVLICFGQSSLTNTVKVMLQDCKYDIDEIRQCKDCYHFSNAKPKDWFCAPCRPPHELVYAKQKGFSYWPAKVIKITKDGYDVRFFGGWHQRAVVVKANVKPIDTSLRNLNMKKPAASFNKACDEMKRHQKLLAKQAEEDEQEGTTRDSSVKEEPEEEEEEEEEEKEAVSEEPEVEEEAEEEEEEPKPPKAKRRKVSEADVISSSNTISDRPAPTPEDANLVTSTEDNVQTPRVFSNIDVGTQTSKKLTHSKQPHKGTQTEDTSLGACSCQSKHSKGFTDKDRPEQQGDKERDLQEITERLRKDSEEDKQQAVARAVTTTQREAERVRRQTEEQVKEQYMEELKKLAQKHKTEVSQTKKKQWCYNCEEEAMYHCCWNTSYCSIKCQQEHWHREHKRCCRRKR